MSENDDASEKINNHDGDTIPLALTDDLKSLKPVNGSCHDASEKMNNDVGVEEDGNVELANCVDDNIPLLFSDDFGSLKHVDGSCNSFGQKIKRLCHWGPFITLFLVFYIFGVGFSCLWAWWPPFTSFSAALHTFIYINHLYCILSNYLLASFRGPGYVPRGWEPVCKSTMKYLQYCTVCQGYKPPRAHHCSDCDRCVLKMDHHCPWINACCGHVNHGYFLRFIFWAPLGCMHAMVVLAICLWIVIKEFLGLYIHQSHPYGSGAVFGPPLLLSLAQTIMALIAFSMALGVTLSVGILLVTQLLAITKNETGIESLIARKAKRRRKYAPTGEPPYINPYNLGSWRANMLQVVSLSGKCVGNGYDWKIRPGSHRFDMTIEQLKQKHDKHQNAEVLSVIMDYNGQSCPIRSFGFRTTCSQPLGNEKALPVKNGDILRITRWRDHWVYGQQVDKDYNPIVHDGHYLRGWFPMKCLQIASQNPTVTHPHEE